MSCVAFIQNPEISATVKKVIDTFWHDGQLMIGDPIEQIAQNPNALSSANILLIDLSYLKESVQFVSIVNDKLRYGQIVIYLGTQNDISLFRKITENQLADYLIAPITSNDIINTAARLSDRKMDLEREDKKNYGGKTIAFVGSHGGVGTSTLVASFAWSLAEELHKKVLLIDLDMNLGIHSFLFDVKPRFGLQSAMDSPSRIDQGLIDDLCVKKTQHLHLICNEASMSSYSMLREDGLIALLNIISKQYDYIIYDMPRSLVVKMSSFVERLYSLLIVTDSTVIGLRDTIILSNQAIFYKVPDSVSVVLNKMKSNNPDLISTRDFASRIKVKVQASLPEETDLLLKSINEAKSVVLIEPENPYVQEVHKLIEKITSETGFPEPKPKNIMNKLSSILKGNA